MARPKKVEDQVEEVQGEVTTTAENVAEVQPSLFPEEKLYHLKLGSVDVPVVEDGKGTWKNVTQRDWNLEYQRALFDYWKEQAAENSGFSIEAKKAKLFV